MTEHPLVKLADHEMSGVAVERRHRFEQEQKKVRELERNSMDILESLKDTTEEDYIKMALQRTRHEARLEHNKKIDEQGVLELIL